MRKYRPLAIVTVIALAGASLAAAPAAAGGSGGGNGGGGGGNGGGGGGDRSVTINPLAVRSSATEITGAVLETTIRLDRRGGNEFRVGFSEDEVGGSGEQWRAAGWSSVSVGTLLTGAALGGNDFTFEINGEIDGPSAGAYLTVAVIALLRGDKLDKTVTMTGTINPDGTIGPVGGIPYKVQAGADEGKATILVPAGQRNALDIDGNLIDVFDVGSDAGAEVQEVEDIYQAYEIFTGTELPRLEGGSAELSTDAYDQLESFAREYLAERDSAAGEFLSLDPAVQGLVQGLAVDSDLAYDRATNLSAQGQQAGAFIEAFEAAALATAAVTTGRAAQIYITQGADAFLSQINSSVAVNDKVDVLFDRLGAKAKKKPSLTEATALIGAYSTAIDIQAIALFADQLIESGNNAATEEEALDAFINASVLYEIADLGVEQAEQIADVGEPGGPKATASIGELEATAEFFRKAASANLNAFDSVVVGPLSEELGVDIETAKGFLQGFDLDYALASIADVLLSGDEALPNEREEAAYASLGAAVQLYARSATLIGKYYSFEAFPDEAGNIVAVANERGLTIALEFAQAQDEGAIGALTDKGIDPTLLVAGFEVAGIDREGGPQEKLESLGGYWYGYVAGRVLAYLGGFERAGLS